MAHFLLSGFSVKSAASKNSFVVSPLRARARALLSNSLSSRWSQPMCRCEHVFRKTPEEVVKSSLGLLTAIDRLLPSSRMAGLGFPVIPPTPPDFHSCNQAYGSMIWPTDCDIASTNLPHGQDPVTYHLRQTNLPNALALPFTVSHGR